MMGNDMNDGSTVTTHKYHVIGGGRTILKFYDFFSISLTYKKIILPVNINITIETVQNNYPSSKNCHCRILNTTEIISIMACSLLFIFRLK